MQEKTQKTFIFELTRNRPQWVYDLKVYDMCNKFDVSIPVGISYQVPTIPIYIDGRAIFGLTDIMKKENLAPNSKNFKNQVFQLTVGYKFAL